MVVADLAVVVSNKVLVGFKELHNILKITLRECKSRNCINCQSLRNFSRADLVKVVVDLVKVVVDLVKVVVDLVKVVADSVKVVVVGLVRVVVDSVREVVDSVKVVADSVREVADSVREVVVVGLVRVVALEVKL